MFSTLRHTFLIDCKLGEIAIWGNGNLVNAGLLRKDLVDRGFIFGTPAATPKSSCTSSLARHSSRDLNDALGFHPNVNAATLVLRGADFESPRLRAIGLTRTR